MSNVKRPCLDCGLLTSNKTRCDDCRKARSRERNKTRKPRPHYAGDYKRRAKAIRDNATTCWLCGEGARADDPFQADHIMPADPTSPLAAAHRSCNIRRAQTMKKQQQAAKSSKN